MCDNESLCFVFLCETWAVLNGLACFVTWDLIAWIQVQVAGSLANTRACDIPEFLVALVQSSHWKVQKVKGV